MFQPVVAESKIKAARTWTTRLVEAVLFTAFVLVIFQFPEHPGLGLDPSWKMVLGQTFHDGRQFGRDVVYNYGPLGFLMGNIYFGLQFWSLIAWQFFAAVVFAAIIIRNGRALVWKGRTLYMVVFLFYGFVYPDSLYMIVIAFMGIELIRRDPWSRLGSAFFASFLAAIALMKFTNLLFALFVVAVVFTDRSRLRRWRDAVWIVAWFGGGVLLLWILCGQSLANIPAYLGNSWQISKGYEEAMGTPAPADALLKALAVLLLLAVYMLQHFVLQRNKPRAAAALAILAAFIFLDWKHGFVRADAHMLAFFISALVPVVACPALMDDPPRFRVLQHAVLLCAGFLAVLGIRDVLKGNGADANNVHANNRENITGNVAPLFHWKAFREGYEESLRDEKEKYDLPLLRKTVGGGTVDLVGNEQAIIFYNGFNYSPRPVFQSFAAYNPALGNLNAAFLASDRAPDFLLVKIDTIDDRLAAMDDAQALRILPDYYTRLDLEERGYNLWKHREKKSVSLPDLKKLEAKDLLLNTPLSLESLAGKNLWLKIDLRASLPGHLRQFLYKPAVVKLTVENADGVSTTYNMPLSEARAGFILNPVIEDNGDYTAWSKGEKGTRVRSLRIDISGEDRRFFAAAAHLEFFELPVPKQ